MMTTAYGKHSLRQSRRRDNLLSLIGLHSTSVCSCNVCCVCVGCMCLHCAWAKARHLAKANTRGTADLVSGSSARVFALRCVASATHARQFAKTTGRGQSGRLCGAVRAREHAQRDRRELDMNSITLLSIARARASKFGRRRAGWRDRERTRALLSMCVHRTDT